jgi:hypothetical protein
VNTHALNAIGKLQRSTGTYARIDDLREQVPGLTDQQIINLADSGEIVLARFDGPKWAAEEQHAKGYLVKDDAGYYFVGVALPLARSLSA